MSETIKKLPLWILILTGILALLEIGVSISLFIDPKSVLETVDMDAKGVIFVVHLWAVRQLALGCVFAYSALKRSIPMLFISYVFYLIMFLGDLILGALQKDTGLMVSAAVMSAIGIVLLYVLNKRK